MGIAAQAPRGGLVEDLAGASRVLILTNAEIERFEDLRRGLFLVWDGFFGSGTKPSVGETRDLVALGLVGGGMAATKADALVAGLAPSENLRLYKIAQGLVGVAFVPDAVADDEAAPADAEAAEDKKKDPTDGMSGGS